VKASIVDVALRARVSKSTVSRVVTGHPSVRPETQRRVREAIDALGYQPNALARSLLNGRSRTIGLIVYQLHNPYFGLLAHGVEATARARGYHVLIADSGDSVAQGQECLAMFAERRVDGVLLAPTHLEEELATVRRAGLRSVLFNAASGETLDSGDGMISFVGADDVRGGYLATRHLLDLGHRRVAFLGNRPGIPACRDRLRGYRQAHAVLDLGTFPELIVEDVLDLHGAVAAVQRLLDLPEPPTAIFAINDEFAIATLQALTMRGCRVPDDVALVGFDDIPVAAWLGVPLTTVAAPVEEFGRIATNLLIDQIEDPRRPAQRVLIDLRLVVRRSCGAARGPYPLSAGP